MAHSEFNALHIYRKSSGAFVFQPTHIDGREPVIDGPNITVPATKSGERFIIHENFAPVLKEWMAGPRVEFKP
jgi:hypothetical protein